jgi:16S rRNA C1402 N4-methylase RsmH
MLKKEEITYIEQMTKQIVNALKEIAKYDNDYIYQIPERAKFDRLRVELNKELMKIRKRIYK